MFSKRSYKPFMKGSFSGGRGLTSLFINDRCLWGAHLVGLQGAGVSATVSLPALQCLAPSSCVPGQPASWAHPPDHAKRTVMPYKTEGTEYLTKRICRITFFCIHKLALMYIRVKKWLQCKHMEGKCGVRFFIWTLCRTNSSKRWRTKSLNDKWGEEVSI